MKINIESRDKNSQKNISSTEKTRKIEKDQKKNYWCTAETKAQEGASFGKECRLPWRKLPIFLATNILLPLSLLALLNFYQLFSIKTSEFTLKFLAFHSNFLITSFLIFDFHFPHHFHPQKHSLRVACILTSCIFFFLCCKETAWDLFYVPWVSARK